ncbi:rCG56458 [Rattus norvegicus]|uniref:RCG56458 n=1 Tax=Rattus norvegicus TaxID=10116 RepID=A6IAG9_RAT|nr:rCG56458 [Rattus norvegicus]
MLDCELYCVIYTSTRRKIRMRFKNNLHHAAAEDRR